ncbi:MAG: hypothetical protein JW839_18335, partial [Candidatus Lokiarchaeota archaeon]|nr:hypothetical protein [Candidatus Lokiarchaeota archaeon]
RMDEFDDIVHQFWFVSYEPGKLEAVAKAGGRPVARASFQTAGAPRRLDVKADRKEVRADPDDIVFAEVSILDGKGAIAPLAENLVTFTVDGPGKILGVANGNPISHEPLDDSQIHLFMGKALAVVQPSGRPGVITLSVHAPMVEPAAVRIDVM